MSLPKIARFATFLAFCVVVLGAYTRLSDAGLGCPDWPGCYGQLRVPTSPQALEQAAALYPEQQVESSKAWTEMIHRYIAGCLGLVISFIWLKVTFFQKQHKKNLIFLSALLLGLLIFQALLGMWTVTLKLYPIVVMGHLIGGIGILSLLWLLALSTQSLHKNNIRLVRHHNGITLLAIGCSVVVFFQIALGGWTSANYAALVCPDFPTCQGQWWPSMAWQEAFRLWDVGIFDSPGTPLENTARVTIQMAHRLGALLTTVLLIALLWIILRRKPSYHLKVNCSLIGLLLLSQITLGISNVLFGLPIIIAVLHNGIAALLLLGILTLTFSLFHTKSFHA